MRFVTRRVCVMTVAILWGVSSRGEGGEEGRSGAYLLPPPAVLETVVASRNEPFSRVLPAPTGRRYLVLREAGMPPLSLLDRPLASWSGLKVDVRARRSLWEPLKAVESLAIYDFEGRRIALEIPPDTRIGQVQWSPDGRWVSFVAHMDDGSRLYVADPASGATRQVSPTPLLLVRHARYDWTADGRSIVAVLVPEQGTKPPESAETSRSPTVRRSIPSLTRRRLTGTIPSNPHDARLYRFLHTGQLTVIDVASGAARKVGKPAMILAVRPSPNASLFRVTIQTDSPNAGSGFGLEDAIWDDEGTSVSRLRTIAPDGDDRRDGQAETWNPHLLADWTPDGRGMSYATPWGVTRWSPVGNRAEVVWKSPNEIREVSYSRDGLVLFARAADIEGESLVAVHLAKPDDVHTLARWKPGDPHSEPARVFTRAPSGNVAAAVVSSDRRNAFLVGPNDAPRPFLDRVEIATGKRERIWQGGTDTFDELVEVLDDDADRIVFRRQSPTNPPETFLRERFGTTTRLTSDVDPSPRMTVCRRENLTITRADGFRFHAHVTLPKPSADGTPPPALFWLYPVPYRDQAAYDSDRLNPSRRHVFPTSNATSPRIITQAGYAAVELDCPIVGPLGKAYDGYVENLAQNLAATVDELGRRGLIDRARLAIGGHSGGATAAACALVYTDHFKAGIAWSGSYDMLLSPTGMGAGHERRPLWEARDNYLDMSALLHADRIRGALLISHGAADANPLTRPVNAEVLHQELEALGRPTMLAIYPLEDHNFAARETILDQWARWILWLDEHVRSNAESFAPSDDGRSS